MIFHVSLLLKVLCSFCHFPHSIPTSTSNVDSSQMGIDMSASLVLSCTEKEVNGSLGSPEDAGYSRVSEESIGMLLWDEAENLGDDTQRRIVGGGGRSCHAFCLLSTLLLPPDPIFIYH